MLTLSIGGEIQSTLIPLMVMEHLSLTCQHVVGLVRRTVLGTEDTLLYSERRCSCGLAWNESVFEKYTAA